MELVALDILGKGPYMIIITETIINRQIGYQILNDETNENTLISYTSHNLNVDGQTYLIMYNKGMEIIPDAFNFLNFHLSDKSYNTRHKSALALKLLYSYEEIFGKMLQELDKNELRNLKLFIKGMSISGRELRLESDTIRSNATTNSYLGIYRQYLSYLGEENAWLSEKTSNSFYYNTPGEPSYSMESYKANEKTGKSGELKRYISVEEFKRIIKTIRSNYTLREELIVRLMYESGLRIGEVLGLTFEDLTVIEEKENIIPVGFIRNRYTDKPFQLAKTCLSINNKEQYKQREYITKGLGFQTFVVPSDLFDSIDIYINNSHNIAKEKYEANYNFDNRADSVTEEFDDEANYYIFINSYGRPLSQASWNKILRDILQKSNISVDKGSRKNNLNHRFRHGFAMFNVQYLKCSELELMNRMRHSSIDSITSYFNPTLQDQLQIKTEYVDSLYKEFEELHLGGNWY